ncbi:MAG TPA: outer membrane lipoprotein carrier protein LolA [Williamwhitmania sp.]|nr:outer membrane lipoprotein carrier protein LolA [Williamwhitmania sp.]
MKKILFLALLMIPMFAFSQKDQRAKDILEDFSKKTKGYKTMYSEFSFTLENQQEHIKDTHKGTITLKGRKYVLDLMGTVTYFNGKTKWTYLKEANEVNILEPKEGDGGVLDDPAKLFTVYDRDFKYKFKEETTINKVPVYVIDLYPKSLAVTYTIVRFSFNQKTMEPVQIKYFSKDGNRYTLDIKKFEHDIPVSEDAFTFPTAKYPGVTVNDLR